MNQITTSNEIYVIIRHHASQETGCQNRQTMQDFDVGVIQTGNFCPRLMTAATFITQFVAD